MSYKSEVKVQGEWVSNACRYATKEEAMKAAEDLFMRWTLVTEYHAVECDDPVNYEFITKNKMLSSHSW